MTLHGVSSLSVGVSLHLLQDVNNTEQLLVRAPALELVPGASTVSDLGHGTSL